MLPFRAVLNSQFEVISVVQLIGYEVKECQVREWANVVDDKHDFGCKTTIFSDKELKEVVDLKCPLTRHIARERFPARFTGLMKGRPFTPSGSQLYIFPLLKSKIYEPNDGMGNFPSYLDAIKD